MTTAAVQRIDIKALLMAVGAGIGLYVLAWGISEAVAFTGSTRFTQMLQDANLITSQQAGAWGGGFITQAVLSSVCASAALGLLCPVGTGATYGLFHKLSHHSVSVGSSAIGGAASAFIATVIVETIVVIWLYSNTSEMPLSSTTSYIGFFLFPLVMCLGIAGMSGAVGGVLYAAVAGKVRKPAPTSFLKGQGEL